LALEELNDAGQIVSIMISIPLYAALLMTESTYKTKKNMGGFPCENHPCKNVNEGSSFTIVNITIEDLLCQE